MRGAVSPVRQYPDEKLKTEMSMTPIPIPEDLALLLSAHGARFPGEHLLTNDQGRQLGLWELQRAFRPPARACRVCPRGSGSTTCATSTRRC
jgi:hypothetical protein